MAVWTIYLYDHLADARVIGFTSANPRRLFFLQYHKVLSALLAVIILVASLLLFQLQEQVLRNGLVLLAVIFSFYVLVKSNKPGNRYKELFTAIIFTAGISLVPLTGVSNIRVTDIFIIGTICLLAYINLLLLSRYEEGQDRQDGIHTTAHFVTTAHLNNILRISFSFTFIFIAVLIVLGTELMLLLPLVGILSVHLLLYFWPPLFLSGYLYRKLGDASFMLPGVVIFF